MAKRRVVVSDETFDEVEAPAVKTDKPKLAGTVTVVCKVPQGMVLQLQHKQRVPIPKGITGRANDYEMVEQNVFGGPRLHVFGPSIPAMGGLPDGYIMPPDLRGGYALTPGIPAAFWAEWLEQNKEADYVKNQMIFALDRASAKAWATERAELTSGIQPLSREHNPDGSLKDRRVPKPITASVARIGFDAERTAQQLNQAADAE